MSLDDAGYHVLGSIARGGMAEVVLAERIGPGGVRKRLAIKRLLPELASEPDFVTLLENEARIAVELDHANIVSVFELGEADGELFLAMEFVRGWDLSTILDASAKRDVPLPAAVAIHIAREICSALVYAHAKTDDRGAPLGIVHRDVSPSNILVSVEGAIKLTDFGIARAAAVARSTRGMWLRGKVPYASPEQVAGEPLDRTSDLYSLGVVLFEMITGKRLFSTDLASAGRERKRALPRLAEIVPEAGDAQAVLDRALAHAKVDRFTSANEMLEALSRVAERLPSRPTDAAVAAYLAELSLPSPVSPENVDDGERTEVMSVGRLPLLAGGPRSVSRTSVSPPPGQRASRRWGVLAAVGAFAIGVLATRLVTTKSAPATRLEIRTSTPGVDVSIDGRHRGLTPLVANDLAPGVHRIVVGSGDAATAHDVDLRASSDQTLDLDVR